MVSVQKDSISWGQPYMGDSFGKVTRMSAIVAVLVAFIMLASPVLQIGGKTVDVSPVKSVQAANGNRVFTVGQVDYGGGMATLNPFLYTQAEELETIWPCYSSLLMYDIDGSTLIGDLANSWTVTPDGLTWDFKIVHNAYFVDPLNPTVKAPARLLTVKDIMWTYWEVNNDTQNHLNFYFTTGDQPEDRIIQSMRQGADQFELIITLRQQYAPFLGAMVGIPIVPEYIWGHLTGGNKPWTYDNLPMVGSGMFYSTMTAVPQTLGVLKRNPIWFQEENRGWQIHVDTLNYKTELSPVTAWTELTTAPTPILDALIQVPPSQYKGNLMDKTTPYVMGWASVIGFVYEYQLNQMSTLERTELQKAGKVRNGGSNNQLLLDPTVKLALAMSIDKQEFVDQVLLGLGTPADSMVPINNKWHYAYPNPIQFDPAGARALLMSAGWKYDSSGADATSTTCPLYKKGPVNNTVYHPLSFRLLSLTPETEWDTGSRLIVNWSREAGVEYTRTLMSTNQANGAWYKGDYDAWLWDWGFTPSSDPSTDCLSVDTTSNIGTWSGSYWSNVTYDKLYNDSLLAMDEGARRVITDKLQAILYEDHAAQYPAWRKDLYAANYRTWNQESFGNWEKYWILTPDEYSAFLYMGLYPNDNHAPRVSMAPSFGPYEVNTTQYYFGQGVDDNSPSLDYQFFWGDGSNSTWQSSDNLPHVFTKDGTYTIYFAAREQGQPDRFISWNKTEVTIINPDNKAPKNPGIVKDASLINSGTIVTFTGNATDTDPLYYSWSFGDQIGGVGEVASHQFKTPGDYTVILNVTDNHPGTGRPTQATMGVHVTPNGQPQVSFPSTRLVQMKQPNAYTATTTDPDGDTMRYTWAWGDGKRDVTTVPTATHTYAQKSPGYNLMLYTDDLTTLSGHNVSRLEVVSVVGNPTPPSITNFSVAGKPYPNSLSALAGRSLLFTGAAKDSAGNDESLVLEFKLGDGVWNNLTFPTPGNNKVVSANFTHAYLTPGTFTAYLYVYDGQNTSQTTGIIITITVNHLPTILGQPTNRTGNVGVAVSVSVVAIDSDPGTVLKYTWDFGDGTVRVLPASTSHVYTTPGNRTFVVYVDDQSGIVGHNVSSAPRNAAIAFILNLQPGWNMVAVPFAGTHYKASTLGLADGDMIAGWNPSLQTYDQVYMKGYDPPEYDFQLNETKGYWVWASAVENIALYGIQASAPFSWAVDVPSGGGWVIVSLCSYDTYWKASNMTTIYSGATVWIVANWSAPGQTYNAFMPGFDPPEYDFAMRAGHSYWIWVDGDGTMAYTP